MVHMIKQVGRSVSRLGNIDIWECGRCQEQWTSMKGVDRCPHCGSGRGEHHWKRWLPFLRSYRATKPLAWQTTARLLLLAVGTGTALYLWGAVPSDRRANVFRPRVRPRRYPPRPALEEGREVETVWRRT